MLLVFAVYDAKPLASIIAQQAYRGRLMYSLYRNTSILVACVVIDVLVIMEQYSLPVR